MSQDLNSNLKIALASIQCFTDDGTLDVGEVNYLLGLAMADGVIDEDEKETLRSIFNRVTKNEVTEATWKRIEEIRSKHDI